MCYAEVEAFLAYGDVGLSTGGSGYVPPGNRYPCPHYYVVVARVGVCSALTEGEVTAQ